MTDGTENHNPASHKESVKKKKDDLEFHERQFVPRNSLLCDLYKNKHICTVHNAFLAILLGQLLHSAASDYFYKGRLNLGLNLIQRGFSNLHLIILIWFCMFLSILSVYFAFKLWAAVRIYLKPKSTLHIIWDKAWMCLIILFYVGFLYYPASVMILWDIKPAARFGLGCEILRLIMKVHAFIRSNAPRVLNYKHHPQQVLCPEFTKFSYFLWVPTLLYKDKYPRTSLIRWKFVASNFLRVIAALLFFSFIFEKYIMDVFEEYGRKPVMWRDVVILFANTPAAMGMALGFFYIMQHAWMNAFAEMLTFADRMFYQDWWTVTCFREFYRKWNIIVQDWLYVYLYQDFYGVIIPKNKTTANYLIVVISAVAHEYLMGVTFGFCLPILSILFIGVGTQIANMGNKSNVIGNIVVLYNFAIGVSILSSFYALEYFYRFNCPIKNPTFASYFVPRLITCKI